MMWGYGWDMGWMWLFGLLIMAGIAVLVLLAVRILAGGMPQGDRPNADRGPFMRSQARRILDQRFASGDLTAEQYQEHIRLLGEDV
jgi:putative membrane protein